MSTNHTPGPWHVEGHFAGSNLTVTDAVRLEPICVLVGNQTQADANLIAAAPELLAALQEIANHATDGPQDYERMARLLVGYARDAIAKAVQS